MCLLQSLVGVAGGATRAALTVHQARRDNMADISAKDGSQVLYFHETIVNINNDFDLLINSSIKIAFVSLPSCPKCRFKCLFTLIWIKRGGFSFVEFNVHVFRGVTKFPDAASC